MFLPSTITLKFGDTGDFVTELQRRLLAVNCLSDGMVNGFFDGNTTNAVRSFQGREGLNADGVAGPETLRRLNGVISGDTSSAPKDDQKTDPLVQPAAAAQAFVWGATPAGAEPFMQGPAVAESIAPEPAAPLIEPIRALEPVAVTPETLAPAPHVPQPPSAGPEALPTMFEPVAAPVHTLPHETAIPLSARPALTVPQASVPPVNAIPSASAIPAAPLASEIKAAENEPVQRGGLLGRTMQFANAMVQKLATYFEAKLPPSVLDEVKEIGVAMARHGVKEVPIPNTPTPVREADLPARTQEPTKAR